MLTAKACKQMSDPQCLCFVFWFFTSGISSATSKCFPSRHSPHACPSGRALAGQPVYTAPPLLGNCSPALRTARAASSAQPPRELRVPARPQPSPCFLCRGRSAAPPGPSRRYRSRVRRGGGARAGLLGGSGRGGLGARGGSGALGVGAGVPLPCPPPLGRLGVRPAGRRGRAGAAPAAGTDRPRRVRASTGRSSERGRRYRNSMEAFRAIREAGKCLRRFSRV